MVWLYCLHSCVIASQDLDSALDYRSDARSVIIVWIDHAANWDTLLANL